MNPNVNPPLKPGQIYLVDGGFSTQLSKYLGAEAVDRDPLWTARSLIESPDIVCRVHRDFLASRYRRDVVGFSRQQCSIWRFSFWYHPFQGASLADRQLPGKHLWFLRGPGDHLVFLYYGFILELCFSVTRPASKGSRSTLVYPLKRRSRQSPSQPCSPGGRSRRKGG